MGKDICGLCSLPSGGGDHRGCLNDRIATVERRLKKRDRTVDRLAEEKQKLEGQLAEAQKNLQRIHKNSVATGRFKDGLNKPLTLDKVTVDPDVWSEIFPDDVEPLYLAPDTSAPKDSAPKTGFQLALEKAKEDMTVVKSAGQRWKDSAPGREGLTIHQQLQGLTDKERMDIFYKFCRYCGSTDPSCQCWNDE